VNRQGQALFCLALKDIQRDLRSKDDRPAIRVSTPTAIENAVFIIDMTMC